MGDITLNELIVFLFQSGIAYTLIILSSVLALAGYEGRELKLWKENKPVLYIYLFIIAVFLFQVWFNIEYYDKLYPKSLLESIF